MSKLNSLIEAKKALEAQGKAEGKAAVAEELTDLFARHDQLEALRWTQYTPHFNDGDECRFGVRDVYYKLKGDVSEDDDDGYGPGFQYPSTWQLKDDAPNAQLIRDVSTFAKRIQDMEEIMEWALGNHCQVTATRDGVEIEEYEHD